MMTEIERRRIQAKFNLLYGDLPVAKRAEMLGVSHRSVKRIEKEQHAPVVAVAVKMEEELEKALAFAKMSEEQRGAAQDRERAVREARQRRITPEFITDEVRKDYPPFMLTAMKRLQQDEYQTVIDILRDRVEDEEELKRIPETIRPYAVETLGFAYHYTGRVQEAIDTFEMVFDERKCGSPSPVLHRACRSMQASAYHQHGDFTEGFESVEEAIRSSREYAPAYYQGLCLAAGTRDPEILAEWMGRIIEAARSSLTYDGIRQFIARCEGEDPDLQWARQHARWARFISELQSALTAISPATLED